MVVLLATSPYQISVFFTNAMYSSLKRIHSSVLSSYWHRLNNVSKPLILFGRQVSDVDAHKSKTASKQQLKCQQVPKHWILQLIKSLKSA